MPRSRRATTGRTMEPVAGERNVGDGPGAAAAGAGTLIARLRQALGAAAVRTDASALSVHARDASHLDWGRPLAVALPATAGEAARVVALCAAAGVPVVPRGAGTGLSGGAVPPDGAVVLVATRLRELGAVDVACGAVRAGPGVLNAVVSRHAAPHGLHFAPDPSSQAASTIGGNIAENAGGPHCLSVGVTAHHLRALSWCDAEGRAWDTGPPVALQRGLDLRSLLCGSEGTLGVVTGAWLQLVPPPRSEQTLLAAFPALDAATEAVPQLLQAGLLPAAVEIIDQAMVWTVEAAFGLGLPGDVEAVAIVELAGETEAADRQAARAEELLRAAGARTVRRAADADERAALWQCRKRAFGAVGRLSPNYVSMDVVVPLGELPGLVAEIRRVRERHGVRIATAFHAGDGNLHPAVHYDERRAGDAERAHAAADDIIRAALARRGSP
ncbi:FAD-binding protein, partial [bacterium]|nr:FAD-binding protein [bacterium]